MIELINEKGIPLTDELREIQDGFHIFRAEIGVDLNPYVFDPMVQGAPDWEGLERSGMEDDDIEEMLLTSKNDFHDPAKLRASLEKLLEFARGLPVAKDTKLLVKELNQLLAGCDAAIKAGDKVQLLADFEDREDPDYDDEDDED